MMYLIYNNDGSIKYQNLVDFIQQGNNNVNKILVAIIGTDPTTFSLTGHFVLPNGEKTDISSDDTDSVTIDNVTYTGVVLSLTNVVTALDGLVRVNIVAQENDTDKVLVTYQTFLTVNTGADPGALALISQEEYQNLVSQIQRNVSNNETILTFTSLPTLSNYQEGQVISTNDNDKIKFYVKYNNQWKQLSLDGYYTADEIDALLAGKSSVSGTTNTQGQWNSLTIDGETHPLGSGGAVYEAGNGIDISGDDIISVDTEVVATQEDLQNVREVAEGKCKTIVLSYQKTAPTTDSEAQNLKKPDGTHFTDLAEFSNYVFGRQNGNSDFNSQEAHIISSSVYFITLDNFVYAGADLYNNFKRGDIILIVETDVPDRWFAGITVLSPGYVIDFSVLETSKIDLNNYYTKAETDDFIGDAYDNTQTYSVGDYVIYNDTLYRCISDISTPEDFNSAKWVACKLTDVMVDLDSAQTIPGVKTFVDKIEIKASETVKYALVKSGDFNIVLQRNGSDIVAFGTSQLYTTKNIIPIGNGLISVGSPAHQFSNGYFSGQVFAENTFNVINASDIVNNTLTQDQYDLITNGKPTLIKGESSLFLKDAIILNVVEYTTYLYLFVISSDLSNTNNYGRTYRIKYRVDSSTKAIQQLNAQVTSYNGYENVLLNSINGKQIPSYPTANTSPQVLTIAANGGALSWETFQGLTNPMTTQGDIIVGGSGGTPTRLGVGSQKDFLYVGSSGISWSALTRHNIKIGFNNGTVSGDIYFSLTTSDPIWSNAFSSFSYFLQFASLNLQLTSGIERQCSGFGAQNNSLYTILYWDVYLDQGDDMHFEIVGVDSSGQSVIFDFFNNLSQITYFKDAVEKI